MTTRYTDYSPYWQIRTRIYLYHSVWLVMVKLYCEVHVQLQTCSNSHAQRTSAIRPVAPARTVLTAQTVTMVTTCCSLYPDSHRGYNLLHSVSRESPWLQLAAFCIQRVTVVTTCCNLYPDSHCAYNLLQSVSRQSPCLQLTAVCIQRVTVDTTCCSLYPDSHRGDNLLQSVSRESPWLQLAAVCIQTVSVVTTC
jgi:hypothetical protein